MSMAWKLDNKAFMKQLYEFSSSRFIYFMNSSTILMFLHNLNVLLLHIYYLNSPIRY